MFTSIDTAIENMIQSHIDEQDFVCRLDAEQYTDSEVNDARADIEGELTELQHRIEALEEKALEAAPAAVEQEPRAVNQIDWIMTPNDMIAGYDSKTMLRSYVRSLLSADQSHQDEMLIAMVLTTARNLINKELEGKA